MISFNVGPSKLSENTKQDIISATKDNVCEMSHRSAEFSKLSEQAVLELGRYLEFPEGYKAIFVSSATEAMQLAVANCCISGSFHFVCGNFSNLFAKISQALGKVAMKDEVAAGEINDFAQAHVPPEADLITITQNETSTGVWALPEEIKITREKNPDAILVVDITSSAGVAKLDLADADTWLFSVQKCFGLPSGLGVLILSPRAVARSLQLEQQGKNCAGYFTFSKMIAKMEETYQTVCTPNILDIFLLGRKLQRWNKQGGIMAKVEAAKEKENLMSAFIDCRDDLEYLAKDSPHRSQTVFCIKADEGLVEKVHAVAAGRGLIVGKGYGELKSTTFRIANFPAIGKNDLEELIKALKEVN